MANIVPATTQISQMLSVYRQMKDMADPGPTGGEKWRAQEQQALQTAKSQQRTQQFNETKGLMSMMLQNYQKASEDPILQSHIQRAMMDVHSRVGRVDPSMGRLLEAFVRNTPGSKQAYEKNMWLKANPAPRITATWEEDPHARGYQEFALSDWRARAGAIGGGSQVPAKNLIPMGMTTKVGDKEENLYVFRDKDGTVRPMTDSQLGLSAMAKTHGIPLGELIVNGGVYGKERTVEINGRSMVTQDYTSIQGLASGKIGPTDRLVIKNEIGKLDPMQKIQDENLKANYAKINKDFMDIAAGVIEGKEGSSNALAKGIDQALKKHDVNWVIENMLKPRYDIPGLQIVPLDTVTDEYEFWNPFDWRTSWSGKTTFSDQAIFKYFTGAQATDTTGRNINFYWRRGSDGRNFLCDKEGNAVPLADVAKVMKKNRIGYPNIDYTKPRTEHILPKSLGGGTR